MEAYSSTIPKSSDSLQGSRRQVIMNHSRSRCSTSYIAWCVSFPYFPSSQATNSRPKKRQKTVRTQFVSLVNGWSVDDPLAYHADHCFDYLRQNIMCAADLTLEKARVDPDGLRRATDGWGTIHHCKDWDKVMETMIDYRFKYAF